MKRILILGMILIVLLGLSITAQASQRDLSGFGIAVGEFDADTSLAVHNELETIVMQRVTESNDLMLILAREEEGSYFINRDRVDINEEMEFNDYHYLSGQSNFYMNFDLASWLNNSLGLGFKADLWRYRQEIEDGVEIYHTALTIPLSFKSTIQLPTGTHLIGKASYYPVGYYLRDDNVKMDYERASGNLEGHRLEVGLRQKIIGSLNFRAGYITQEYSHDDYVEDGWSIVDFETSFEGAYLGLDFGF
ncbi:hypothetical protein [Fuchsiella alkaliacetigena]|uniref:hypothetical protein n=1 Tax=Fuchsiella alkaliacetigena TaxID=957042 RepID=UPI00200A745D|nr:hypothetical protein [Fuchsiella alkaliacetigena]MCK8825646.1 hypothetical protein [Fuchsiella alkaliacetigena]